MSKLHNFDQKIRASLPVETDKMRALGASDADVREDAFIKMVRQKVLEELFMNLGPDEKKELWLDVIEMAPPEGLRMIAGKLRACGVDAYGLEHLADLRERGAE